VIFEVTVEFSLKKPQPNTCPFGSLAVWQFDRLAVWRFGSWRFGSWRFGSLAVDQFGRWQLA
jgi:hypothetical protein